MKTTTLSPATAAALESWELERKKADEPRRATTRAAALKKWAADKATMITKHALLKKDAEPVYAALAAIDAKRAGVIANLNAIERDINQLGDAIYRADGAIQREVADLGGSAIDAVLPRLLRAAREAQGAVVYSPQFGPYGNQVASILRTPELVQHADAMRTWAGRLTAARLDKTLSPVDIDSLCREAMAAIAAGPAVVDATAPEFRFPRAAIGLT